MVTEMLEKEELSAAVFSTLKNSSYFAEVWKINPVENLVINLLILFYRTTVLIKHSLLLVDDNGNNNVQISSTLEEMIYCQKYEGVKTSLFDGVKLWLKNWKEEGFDEKLYKAIF
jgi:hypothetical protein